MAETSKIEWTDATFNPWLGCEKVSPGCDHCYAEGWAKRTGNAQLWQGQRRRTVARYWQQPIKWNRQAEAVGVRRRVFCASLADVFDNQVPDEWRSDLWALIAMTPSLDWLLLTKRPQNIAKMAPKNWPNIWLGCTTENQEEADRRIPHLLSVPARVHFLSCEPLLGPVDLRAPNIDWVIVGGESGPRARDMSADWARFLRDQCRSAGVAFFMKQMTRKAPIPDDLMVREFPQ